MDSEQAVDGLGKRSGLLNAVGQGGEMFGHPETIAVILGGGQGTRLFPLTKERCKPAVPLCGKYRLVDIPISNCVNSGINKIFLVTQFNSYSLHRHIQHAYKFDQFGAGFVAVLAAQQSYQNNRWYQGTADAVRQNLMHLMEGPHEHILILSGDQLYQLDFDAVLSSHTLHDADITIATKPVPRETASSLGLMRINHHGQVVEFAEKPEDSAVLDRFSIKGGAFHGYYPASMGIYLFKKKVLQEVLQSDNHDFGKHIIPESLANRRVFSFQFTQYWEDIGTIGSFFAANLEMASETPSLDLFNPEWTIYTRPRHLPSSAITGCDVQRAIVTEGCRLEKAKIENASIGIRSWVRAGSHLRDVVMMGGDFYERNRSIGLPAVGVGEDSFIERAILDKNVRIGRNVHIRDHSGEPDGDFENYHIRDGVVVVPKNTVIPDGSVI